MHPDKLLLILAIVSITCLLHVGLNAFRTRPSSRSVRLFFGICVCAIFYVFNVLDYYAVDPNYRFNFTAPTRFLTWLMPNAIPGLLMLFCYSLFQESGKLPRLLIAALIFQLFLVTTRLLVYEFSFQPPAFFANDIVRQSINMLINLMLLGFSAGAVFWTVKDWRNDLVEGRRILRGFFIVILSVITLAVVLFENFLVSTDAAYLLSQRITIFIIALFSFAMSVAASQFDYTFLDRVVEKTQGSDATNTTEHEWNPDLDAFNDHFIGQKLFQEPGLTIAILAKKLAMPEYRLRRLISQQLGYRNFSAMLHHYRIEEASQQLADAKQVNTPILTIALTVGYKSITPFNTAFRELKNQTPSEYRKQTLSQKD